MNKTEFERFTLEGQEFVAYLADDDTGMLPWEECDGHGPVSDWRPLDSKRPGERVLCEDRRSARFYDFAEAIKLARKDGWDAPPYKTGTKGEQAVRAVEADYEYLRRFCVGAWGYVGVIVGDESLWGIESDAIDYHKEIARELAQQVLHNRCEALRRAEVKHCLVGCAP